MEFFVNSIICFIIAVFPTLLSTFYVIYTRSLEKKERSLCTDMGIIFTQYILVLAKPKLTLLIASIPFLIGLLEKRNVASICTALILIYLSCENYNFNLIFLIIEYSLLLLILVPYKYKKISKYHVSIIYTAIKLISFWILSFNDKIGNVNVFSKHQIFMISITFIVAVSIFTFFYDKCKSATNLFMTVKDIEENRQIKQTLFTISHEIKNPLAVCKGYLDMYDYNNPVHAKKYVSIISSEIDKALVILQDFLNLTKTNLKKESLDINCLIEDCVENLELLFKSNGIVVKEDLLDDEIYVYGDYNRLQQVLVNVIKNAVEAMEDSDKKELILKTSIEKRKVFIEIMDTGKGIDPELINKIKDPFYTTKKNGTGLGVPFSIEIITAHDGEIDFLAREKGTNVKITLPLEL